MKIVWTVGSKDHEPQGNHKSDNENRLDGFTKHFMIITQKQVVNG